ncbi:MAG TPA: nucleoside-diphosphate kinase [Chlamydiales bacterium]|nr:nucleoside-diphosphate kinase [Chlamydiales bacterium]
MEQTLSIIKPDAVAKNHIGDIIAVFEKKGLKIAAARMFYLQEEDAKKFYEVHQGRPFFEELVDFMCSGPIVAMVLEGKNAVAHNREIMGATDPAEAAEGTIRKMFAASKGMNAVHGSDSLENAKKEISFFFTPEEIFSRS